MGQRFQVFSPYHPDEVSVLIHSYLELRSCSSAFVRTRIMDLSKNFKRLPWHERHALFLKGVCGLPSREVGALLEISHTHTITHYNNGRDRLLRLMNGLPYDYS